MGYNRKVVTFGRPRNWLILLVKLCDLSENHHSLKSPYSISLIHKKFEDGSKTWDPFSQATQNREHCWVTNNLLYLQ